MHFLPLLLLLIPFSHQKTIGLIFSGRSDVSPSAYDSLGSSLTSFLSNSLKISVFYRYAASDLSIPEIYSDLKNSGTDEIFLFSHSMSIAGISLQNFVITSNLQFSGLILLSGFLQRIQRPDIISCLQKSILQPVITWNHPLGYLADGSHDCFGPNIPNFPISTFSIGGELDGVVRVTRIAESFFTQVNLGSFGEEHPVVVIAGMNHGVVLNGSEIPIGISKFDLKSEISHDEAVSKICEAVGYYVGLRLGLIDGSKIMNLVNQTGMYLETIFSAFVNQEGNWFFTGGDEEHGSSLWAAQAQIMMASPLPTPFTWTTKNFFHLLSDEEDIPPYYRPKHRPEMNVTKNTLSSETVTQLRFIEVTLAEVDAGLNGWGIIKEEKLNILTAIPDDGSTFVSAIEIATKLMSRQKIFNLTGNPSPESLDDGNRCAEINQFAYDWALAHLPPKSLARWNKYGIPLEMGSDEKPFPDAGPFWIWKYLAYNSGPGYTLVQAPYAFFSLDANPYGAGNHYCKLLSPARVMEWMLVDGLRENYSL